LVANHGAIMIFQHSVRIILFTSFLSFSIQDYILFIFILALTGYAGAKSFLFLFLRLLVMPGQT